MIIFTTEGGHHPVIEGLNKTKRLNSLSAWAKTAILDIRALGCWAFGLRLGLTPLAFLIFRPLGLDGNYPPAFLALQLTKFRLWNFSTSIITWTNSYNTSSLISFSVSCCFCLSGEPWLIHQPRESLSSLEGLGQGLHLVLSIKFFYALRPLNSSCNTFLRTWMSMMPGNLNTAGVGGKVKSNKK